jgi:GNAT superfamily N-acetyltransferase
MQIEKHIETKTYAIKLVATHDGSIRGWAYVYIIYNDLHAEPYGLLENVFVEEAYRGQGVGTALIQEAISEAKARGCYKIIAQSRHGKPDVHALYEKHGFRNHGLNFRMDLIEQSIS